MATLSITAANVTKGTDATVGTGTAGATITAGQVLYVDLTDSNKLKVADTDVAASSVVAGVALHAALSGQPIDYIKDGTLQLVGGVTVGKIYVAAATTAGNMITASSVSTSDYMSIVGVGTATSAMKVAIVNSGVAIA